MRLTVLGCAGSFPGAESACSAYLVEAQGFGLLIDLGSGALSALQRYASLDAVDAIVLTHLHADHMLDACPFVVVRRYAPDGPKPPVPVYAPLGAGERISAAYSGDNHPVETYGIRVEQGGRVIAYSSDTAPCEALLRLDAGADLFLC